ncbi:hypothetical protein K1T71_015312 [Dendrolimus kikuchii]|nr:hypothetical protein K1T71_015312 [Dendrolimus kikuchii]
MSTSTSYEENDLCCTPPDIRCEALNVMESLLPENSKEKYLLAYQNFIKWQNSKNTQSFSENVFMAYFKELSSKYKPSSLWCLYSMLKSTVRTKNGVALIFGVTGACRIQELTNVTVKNIENHGQMLLVKIPITKNKIPRSFTIHGPFYEIVKKYESLRSPKAKTDRFFLNYQNGKCTCQPIGINKFGSMPKDIAKFLGLADAESYTGHNFRRTSATLLVNSGADIMTLKRHGGCSRIIRRRFHTKQEGNLCKNHKEN